MADVTTADAAATSTDEKRAKHPSFSGTNNNMVVAVTMLLAGLLAFTMNMTSTFFAEATAWTFIIWGALLLFIGLLDYLQTYEVRDDVLVIRNPLRFWASYKEWPWENVYRMDVLVGRRTNHPEDAKIHIYRDTEGELIKQREDRSFDAKLAELVVEKAGLQPVEDENPDRMAELPMAQKATYHWTKNGSLA